MIGNFRSCGFAIRTTVILQIANTMEWAKIN